MQHGAEVRTYSQQEMEAKLKRQERLKQLKERLGFNGWRAKKRVSLLGIRGWICKGIRGGSARGLGDGSARGLGVGLQGD